MNDCQTTRSTHCCSMGEFGTSFTSRLSTSLLNAACIPVAMVPNNYQARPTEKTGTPPSDPVSAKLRSTQE